MTQPPPYPRIPQLVPGRGTRDDRVVRTVDLARVLASPVLVEEKLDGANVSLWAEQGVVLTSLRSGPGSVDRARQLGPLRAWVAERHDPLASVLSGGLTCYAEWLLLTHTVPYDRLPSYLVALDFRRPDGTFLDLAERKQTADRAGLVLPPELWRGVPGEIARLEALIGTSRYGSRPAEGLVIRREDGCEPRVTKLVRAGFSPVGNRSWSGVRPRNSLADREVSWH